MTVPPGLHPKEDVRALRGVLRVAEPDPDAARVLGALHHREAEGAGADLPRVCLGLLQWQRLQVVVMILGSPL